MEQLSSHDVCVLRLSTLFEEAMKEHTASDTGMLISYYDDISNSNGIIDDVLPLDCKLILKRRRIE